jgi:uncharacterized protein
LYRFFLLLKSPMIHLGHEKERAARYKRSTMLTTYQAILVIFAVFGTSILSGIFGMAGGLILMGVLASLLTVPLAMAAHGFAQLLANGTRFLSLRKHVYWRGFVFYAMGTAMAAGIFWIITYSPSRALLFFTLGAIPLSSLLPWAPKLDFQKPAHAIFCGFLNTGAHFTAGVSGPLLDLFFVQSKMNRFQIIGTKALTQTLGHALKIGYFGTMAGALIELPAWVPAGVALSAIGGTFAGGWVLRKMSEESFRVNLKRIFLLIGCVYLARGAWELFAQ